MPALCWKYSKYSRVEEDCARESVSVCNGYHDRVPQTEWLQQKCVKCMVLEFWRLEVQNEGVGSVMLSPKPVGKEDPSFNLPASGVCQGFWFP